MQTQPISATDEPVHFALAGRTACGRTLFERRMNWSRHLLWEDVTCEACLEPGRRQRMEQFARNDIDNWGPDSRVAQIRAEAVAARQKAVA